MERTLYGLIVGGNLIVSTDISAISEAAILNGRLGWVEPIGVVTYNVDLKTIPLT